MRYELIDRIVERSAERLVAVKAVTSAEEYLADHFPTFPVLPGVLMLEALVQAGRALAGAMGSDEQGDDDEVAEPLVLAQVRNVRYGNMVRPGETLVVEVTLKSRTDQTFEMMGVGKVNDQVAVQGRFTLAPVPMPKPMPTPAEV